MQHVDIVEAYTLKADGTRKPVHPDAIRKQLAPGVPNVAMFADMQQKVVVFPDLAVGDTEVLTIRTEIDHPLFPGHFTWADEFERSTAWQDVAITVTAPRTFPLYTETFELASERSEQEHDVRYVWHYTSAGATPGEQAVVSGWDHQPRLFVSSFPDYEAFAAAYDALAAPKSEVTPDIQATADAVTAGDQRIDGRRRERSTNGSAHISAMWRSISAGARSSRTPRTRCSPTATATARTMSRCSRR